MAPKKKDETKTTQAAKPGQGESIPIKSDGSGFSSTQKKDKDGNTETNANAFEETMRANMQCYLIDNMKHLQGWAPTTYPNLTVFAGDPVELRKSLYKTKGLGGFMDLSPHHLAALVPVFKLFAIQSSAYKAEHGGSHQNAASREVAFQSFATPSDISAIGSAVGTVRAMALKEFYYEQDGAGAMTQNVPGASSQPEIMQAHLKFVGDSMSALDWRGPSGKLASVGDLVIAPLPTIGGSGHGPEIDNENFFMLRASWGWSIPPEVKAQFSERQKAAIKQSYQHMVLVNQGVPQIMISEKGTIEVEMKFLARVELDPNRKTDVLNGPVDGPRAQKARQSEASIMKSAKAAEKAKGAYNDALKKVKDQMKPATAAKIFKGKDLASGVDTDALNAYTDPKSKSHGKFKDDFVTDGKKGKSIAAIKKMIKKAGEKGAKQKELGDTASGELWGSKIERYARTLNMLNAKGQIRTISVKKEDLGISKDGKSLAKISLKRVAADAAKAIAGAKKYDAMASGFVTEQNKHLFPGKSVGHKFSKEERQFGADKSDEARKAKQHLLEISKKEKARKEGSKPPQVEERGLQQKLVAENYKGLRDWAKTKKPSEAKKDDDKNAKINKTQHTPLNNDRIEVHYTYVGAILNQIISDAGATPDGSLANPRLLVGQLEYPDPANPQYNTKIPLADIPISINMFRAWMLRFIVGPGLDSIGINKYIDLLITGLLLEVFNGGSTGCFQGPSDLSAAGKQGASFNGFEAMGGQAKTGKGPDRVPTGRFGTIKVPDDGASAVSLDRHRLPYYYVVIHATFSSSASVSSGNKEKDEKNGLYWLPVRASTGPIQSITFERLAGHNADAFAGTGTDTSLQYGVEGFVFTRYKVKAKMVGNNLFKLMGDIKVDLDTIGATKDRDAAIAFGFGGMYKIVKIHGTIDRTGWSSEIEAFPAAGDGSMKAIRSKHLGARPKLFPPRGAGSPPSKKG